MPSVKRTRALQSTSWLASLPAEVEDRGYVFNLGRLQAGRAEGNERPQAASGEAKNSQFAACRLNYSKTIPVRWAAAAYKSVLRRVHQGGRKCKLVQVQSGPQHSTLNQPQALPNPSLKLSTNSKAPGPRYSAAMHFLQRGPGALLSAPA
jgi:hypothetical protein